MYAVIVSGGKQYRVTEGQTLKLEKLVADVGSTLDFPQVLMLTQGEDIHVGTPYVKGSTVTAEVISHGRGKKIRIVKMRRRKHFRKQMGHRQAYTEIKITQIAV
ncbi:MAG: 50S ribosomal protein L21 [Gammaproteobacteria bacterium]